ncbi:MAG: SDR family oxidoreductase [Proteobacteria bacterium]|nr:SDR family oxidoreductase [Pseudomonadota bacterium]
MTKRLQDKIALVLGAGSVGEGVGNGRAIAMLFAREGAQVAGVDLRLEAAEETRRRMSREGHDMLALGADVTDAAALRGAVDATLARFGRIDVLINNVGGSIPGGPEDIDPQAWHAQFHHNLHYVYLSTRMVAPLMVKQGAGAIVNLSSIAGLRHLGNELAAYAAAKAGLQHFSRVTAVRYAPHNVRINTVIPGLMNTPLVAARLATSQTGGDVQALIEKRDARPPMGHMGDAWDVAWAVLYLASDEAKYVTGAEIVVDGGLTATAR